MSSLQHELATLRTLWWRDLIRAWRTPARFAAALAQPLLLWVTLGAGLGPTFRTASSGLDYFQYFLPGALVLALVLAAVSAMATVIDDRRQGFFSVVLSGPGSSMSLVAGRCLGGTTLSIGLTLPLLLLAAALGGSLEGASPWLLLVALGASAVALCAWCFTLAWWVDEARVYSSVAHLTLLPMWLLSGAVFPSGRENPAFAVLMSVNPLAYSVAVVRAALHGGELPAGTVVFDAPRGHLVVLLALACGLVAVALLTSRRERGAAS